MKKSLSIVLGLSLIGSSVILFTNASRDVYHSYLYRQASSRRLLRQKISTAPFRPFSERRGKIRRRIVSRGSNARGHSHAQNLRYSLHDTRNAYSKGFSVKDDELFRLPFRPTTNRIGSAWQSNLNKRGGLIFKTIKDAVTAFQTFENDTFSVQIPEGWFPSKNRPHFFRSRLSDYTISIKKVDNKCEAVSFEACAIALSKNENHTNPAEKILNVTTIERLSQFSDTILDDSKLQTKTFTESFIGRDKNEEKFISRFFVADLDNGVFMIETKTSTQNAFRYIGVSKKIFSSFRIFSK